jgi:hypothetical protein
VPLGRKSAKYTQPVATFPEHASSYSFAARASSFAIPFAVLVGNAEVETPIRITVGAGAIQQPRRESIIPGDPSACRYMSPSITHP